MSNQPEHSQTMKKEFRQAVVFCLLVGLAWLGLGAGDWLMRLRWFRWQDGFVIRPSAPFAGPYAAGQKRTIEPHKGGDLTQLIGIPAAVERFGETKPGGVFITDEYGFVNMPPTDGKSYPIVVAGDSYMLAGPGFERTFSARLEQQSGQPVYNYSYEGRGSFWGLMRFLLSERFQDREPRVLIWSLIERDIAGDYFAGVEAHLDYFAGLHTNQSNTLRFNWHALQPKSLKSSLPSTSAYAQLASRRWNEIRYFALGRFTRFVTEAAAPVDGKEMLLYYPAIDSMRWSPKTRFLSQAIRIIKLLDHMAKERGIELVIVLIPDKERVYSDLIPDRFNQPDLPIRPTILPEVEQSLAEAGIPVVNLLPSFLAARAAGQRLYWLDDTHWNPAGIDLAVEKTLPVIAPFLEPRSIR